MSIVYLDFLRFYLMSFSCPIHEVWHLLRLLLAVTFCQIFFVINELNSFEDY